MKKRYIAFALLLVLLVGCQKTSGGHVGAAKQTLQTNLTAKRDTATEEYSTTEPTEATEATKPPEIVAVPQPPRSWSLDDEAMKIVNARVTMSGLSALAEQARGMTVDFPYSEYYQIEQCLEKYEGLTPYRAAGTNLFENGEISVQKLYDIVSANAQELPQEVRLTDEDRKTVCAIIAEVVNDYAKLPEADLLLTSEKLSQLKLRTFQEMAYGYYDDKSVTIGFDLSNSVMTGDFLRETVIHETYHMLAFCSPQEESNGSMRSGFSYRFADDTVSGLYYAWFNEGAAEYMAIDYLNVDEPEMYQAAVQSIDAIKLAILPRSEPTALERLSLKPQLSNLFECFGAETRDEQIEVLRLMFVLEMRHDVNLYASSRQLFEALKENGVQRDRTQLEREIDRSVAQTLSKRFYITLADLCDGREIGVKELFSALTIFETMLSKQTFFVERYTKAEVQDFFRFYQTLQTALFAQVADALGVSTEEVQRAFNAFYEKAEPDIASMELLTDAQRAYLVRIWQKYQNDRIRSVNAAASRV